MPSLRATGEEEPGFLWAERCPLAWGLFRALSPVSRPSPTLSDESHPEPSTMCIWACDLEPVRWARIPMLPLICWVCLDTLPHHFHSSVSSSMTWEQLHVFQVLVSMKRVNLCKGWSSMCSVSVSYYFLYFLHHHSQQSRVCRSLGHTAGNHRTGGQRGPRRWSFLTMAPAPCPSFVLPIPDLQSPTPSGHLIPYVEFPLIP